MVKLEPLIPSGLGQFSLLLLPGLGLPPPSPGMADSIQSCLGHLWPGFTGAPNSWRVLQALGLIGRRSQQGWERSHVPGLHALQGITLGDSSLFSFLKFKGKEGD